MAGCANIKYTTTLPDGSTKIFKYTRFWSQEISDFKYASLYPDGTTRDVSLGGQKADMAGMISAINSILDLAKKAGGVP